MAYPTRRDGSQPSGCHYLDGVPVKIGESFRPPRKITLPLSYQQRYPVELLSEEYDFSLENQVVKLAETKRRGREASERARAEQLATTIEAFTRHNGFDSSVDGSNGSDPSDVGPEGETEQQQVVEGDERNDTDPTSPPRRPPDDASSLLTSLEPNSMLQPVQTRSGHQNDKPDVTLTSTAAFNLADFEAESSPFDSVALRSLNDIEELRSVLLNVQGGGGNNGGHHYQPNANTSSPSPAIATGHHHHNRRQTSDASDSHSAHYDGTGTQYTSYDQMSSSAPTHSAPFPSLYTPSALAHPSPQHHHHPNLTHNTAAGKGWSGGSVKGGAAPYPGGPEMVMGSGGAAAPTTTVVTSPAEDMYAVLVPIRNTRSTPDILKELGVTPAAATDHDRRKAAAGTTAAQPQRPSSAGPVTLPDPEPRTPGGASSSEKLNRSGLSKAEHGWRPRPTSASFESEPDGRALVRHVTEMGFPRARVTRAVQKLGNDDKKVVEHLCMIQTLVEQGYNGDDAECALFLNNHIHSQAKEYLDLLIQFRDLGFDDESIKRALLHCDNNRDKALDYLVS